jgi:hypothetical protein
MEIIAIIILIGIAIALIKSALSALRRKALLEKYGDATIVDRIMKGKIWQGMSLEQLIDSWGTPAAKDHKIYKTKISETYKYNPAGKNRFRSRVKIEDGFVVGWEQK